MWLVVWMDVGQSETFSQSLKTGKCRSYPIKSRVLADGERNSRFFLDKKIRFALRAFCVLEEQKELDDVIVSRASFREQR
jgi:hypothetical protein